LLAVQLIILVVTATPSTALEDARRHLKAGQLDDVLLDLEDKTFEDQDAKAAGEVLGEAAQKALKTDPLLALHFAQLALRQDPWQLRALEVAARTSLDQKQFGDAESYGDGWIAASGGSAASRLFRAEVALEEGEWDKVRALVADPSGMTAQQRLRAKQLRAAADRELKQRQAGLTTARALQEKLDAAAARAAKQYRRGVEVWATAPRSGVVVYGTSWCGFCRKARQWLSQEHIDFTDKDVEKDPGAAEELAAKARAAGVHPRGVPVIDARGTLVMGFDQPRLRQLLK
jgi:glutaredoxin